MLLGKTSQYPAQWDPRVDDLVRFVEQQRALTFDHPVYIDFLSEDEFKQKVATPTDSQTDEQKQDLQDSVKLFRALGLLQGDVNLLEQSNQLRQGGTLAFYDPATKHVYVRGTALDTSHKVTLVHELTHALQDQQFDLTRLAKLTSGDERTAFRTIVEGDAVRIENKYVAKLSDKERQAYEDQSKKDSDTAKQDVSSVPDVLVASFAAPYQFGTPFLEMLEAKGGTPEVNNALRKPPTGEGQILDPSDYFAHRPTADVKPPALPAGATKITSPGEDPSKQDDHLGVLTFFMMLSARIDPHQALAAADVWNGDATLSYRDNDKVCAKITVAADDAAGADTLAPILDSWQQKMPVEAGTTVQRSDDRFEITTCDPGAQADVGVVGKPSDAFALPTARLVVFGAALHNDVPLPRATCVARSFTDNLAVEDVKTALNDVNDAKRRFADAGAACPG